MKLVSEYWKKVADFTKRATQTPDPLLKTSYLDQAHSYKLLAEDRQQRVDRDKDVLQQPEGVLIEGPRACFSTPRTVG